jgi:hypothetical protein
MHTTYHTKPSTQICAVPSTPRKLPGATKASTREMSSLRIATRYKKIIF